MKPKHLRVVLVDHPEDGKIPLTDRMLDQQPQMRTILVNTWSGEWDFIPNINQISAFNEREQKEKQIDFDLKIHCAEIASKSINVNENNIAQIANSLYDWISGKPVTYSS